MNAVIPLRIAGVNHFDPAGRQRLADWLVLCSQKLGEPAFIATEWDENIFRRVEAQRGEFRNLMRNQWPGLSEGLLKTLTRSLAYEGDTHIDLFPNVEVLWLDEGRQASEEDILQYARDRFEMYRRWLGEEVSEVNDSLTLAKMSERATKEAGCPPDAGDARDAKFAELILRRVEKGGRDWAVVIVGKFHALTCNGSMRRLLEDKKQVCAVSLL